MKYQVLVLDLDGTLTNSKGNYRAIENRRFLGFRSQPHCRSCQRAADQRCCASCKKNFRWILSADTCSPSRRTYYKKCSTGEIITIETIPKRNHPSGLGIRKDISGTGYHLLR